MRSSRRSGFSLIELLVVIAIIAILAALVFPVFSRVKESARQTNCLSNMHQIWVALSMYKQDEGVYPSALLGYPERPDGTQVTAPSDPHVGADAILHGYLLNTKRSKDPTIFNCPDNLGKTKDLLTVAHFPPKPTDWTGPWVGDVLASVCPTDSAGTIVCRTDDPSKTPVYYYAWDSYDIGPRIDPQTGKAVVINGATVYDLHYSRDWTGASGPSDLPNQLKYPSPPGDHTIMAWCTYHQTVAGTGNVMALTMGGGTKKVSLDQIARFGPGVFAR